MRPFDDKAFDAFYDTEVAFSATRPGGRPVALAAKCCVFESDPEALQDSPAPSGARRFTAMLRVRDWIDAEPPRIGDALRFAPQGETEPVDCRVLAVRRDPTGDFIIAAEQRAAIPAAPLVGRVAPNAPHHDSAAPLAARETQTEAAP